MAGPVAPDCPHPRTDRPPGLPVDNLHPQPCRLHDAHGKRQRRDGPGSLLLHVKPGPGKRIGSASEDDEKRLRPAREHRPGLCLDRVPRHADGKPGRGHGRMG